MALSASLNQEWDLETANNTWTEIQSYDIYEGRTVTLNCQVYAFETGGDAMMTEIRALVRREPSASLTPVFSAVYTLLNTQKTLGALLWDVRLRLDGAYARVEAKGKVSGQVFWMIDGIMRSYLDDAYAP